MWKAYLEEVREEVRLGVGVFNEDEQLRSLFQECFDVGDVSNGAVFWGDDTRGLTSVDVD
jgi:hypothetical protein